MIARQIRIGAFLTLAFAVAVGAQSDLTDESPHKTGFVTVNNVKLHYLDWGGSGESLLFLHGMGGTAHHYDDFAPRFTNQFRVLALTRRGHGESEMPQTGYDTTTLVDDVRQFLNALKIQRVVLAGHSFAGDELTRFAVVHPDRVIKLIYFDSAYDHSRVPENLRWKPLHGAVPELLPTKEESESPDGGRRWVMRIWGEKTGRAIHSMIEGTYAEKHQYAKIKAPTLAFFATGYCPSSPADSICRGFDQKKVVDWAESLPEQQRKNAQDLIKAQQKYYKQEIEHFRREIPNGRTIVFTNADHVCFIDREPEVLREMRAFLSDTGRRRPGMSLPPFVDLQIPVAPTPVKADGKQCLVYELHITNFFTNKLDLTRIEVLGDRSKEPLASYHGEELDCQIAHVGFIDRAVAGVVGLAAPSDQPNERTIRPGLRAVMFLLLTVEKETDVPEFLRHRLFFKPTAMSASDNEDVVEGAQINVIRKRPLVLGPPLRSGGWLAAGALSNTSYHRRSVFPIDGRGRAQIPERFAIDWAKLGPDGNPFHDGYANTNAYSYGEEVLAVANAVVADVQDGIPENDRASKEYAIPLSLETVSGNSVVLDLGKRRFAHYAHLQPNSLRVRPGQKVRRGQVLGLLGNSGHSHGPHLHFHVADANSFGAEGVPYVFESFELQGVLPALGEAWKPPPNAKTDKRRMEIPTENAVVRFP
jgi:murein DD-endopeptidase